MNGKIVRLTAFAGLAAASGAVLGGTAQAAGNSYDGADGRDGSSSANCRMMPMGAPLSGLQQCQSAGSVGQTGSAY